jgi:hypothetical protein
LNLSSQKTSVLDQAKPRFGYLHKHPITVLVQVITAQSAAGALPIRIAGSTGSIIRDTTGPQINLYLNDTTFKNGGITSENPILIAQLYDTSGINATGNGIGHDIVLVQNNDERNSIVLNSFFSTELNQYQRGEIRYQLATLPEGKYQLKLKAWDLVNNSNQALLDFTVVKKNQLRIAQVRNYPNPVRFNGGLINGALTMYLPLSTINPIPTCSSILK